MKVDPLRLFSSFAILGDIFLIISGGYFFNPIRSLAAMIGLSTHAIGVYFGSKHSFSFKGKKVLVTDIVMSIVILASFLYILSGSNVLGFEDAPRYSEIIVGLLIGTAATCIILGKSSLGSIFFTIPPFFHILQSFETWSTQDKFDTFQLLAGLCFLTSGLAARFIKKP